MGNVAPLPTPRVLLTDARSHGLRATWRPDRGEVVMSVWHADECVGTVRLSPAEAARLAGFLTRVLGDAAQKATAGVRLEAV